VIATISAATASIINVLLVVVFLRTSYTVIDRGIPVDYTLRKQQSFAFPVRN